MLNITNNKLNKKVSLHHFASVEYVNSKQYGKYFSRFLLFVLVLSIVVLFLPWTQNINAKGAVTTLQPNQRPQTIQSQIPGRIEHWYVQEGDFVKKGDTILRISEVKSDYFDDQLLQRTDDQIQAKNNSVNAYNNKLNALQMQITSLQQEQQLKYKQAQNKLLQSKLKVKSDSIAFEAEKTNYKVAEQQYKRELTLQEEGLKAVKDVEAKRVKLQESQSKLIAQENKLISSKNDVLNAQIDLSSIKANYAEKISKARSDLSTAESSLLDAKVEVTKLENTFSNYKKRSSLLFVTAPQDGFINKAIKGGIGEIFKEGEALVGIMPANYNLAVETYVKPIDLPLIHMGEEFRVQFDGWPAIVFSGWPNVSYGTYGAKVVAIENFISANGKFRVLLAPDESTHDWPDAIRVGSGARTIALLNDVPIWFELWRQLNGFPPNYYQPQTTTTVKKKK
ncbi:HlyD family secretion protein [Tenacibaculum sp. IB213877]|uniref:HlyD family secretion protein n=1 Tax=Tenacibaculum sp. IB213877 TaxID=3097351 RepID=UPI002A5AC8E8|nr:biotin/lipoyl-binding protein [Tenacibaculum sp. IB213877]MDY0781466.1 biotin/lipoyl-binding protein [Tenacibaculum sp. IB213877]